MEFHGLLEIVKIYLKMFFGPDHQSFRTVSVHYPVAVETEKKPELMFALNLNDKYLSAMRMSIKLRAI